MKSSRTKVSLILASLLTSGVVYAADAQVDLAKEIEALKAELNELKATVKNSNFDGMQRELSAIKKATYGDNLKFSADYRYTIDSIEYKHISGKKSKNDDFMSNRLILGMKYAPTDDLSFIGELSYNKAFGDTDNHAQSNTQPGYANFDWVTNENATDNTVKVKQAYFLYKNDNDTIPYTASVGRRPSVNGYPLNLRENDQAASPNSHLINVEFDGASFKFDLDKITDISGMYFKICLGRGLTNAKQRFSMDGTDYAQNNREDSKHVDMYGFVFVPYNDGQYHVLTNFAWAKDMIGYDQAGMNAYQGAYMAWMMAPTSSNYYDMIYKTPQFKSVGDWNGGAITLGADGIGEDWGDFMDETKAFVSWAFTKTKPQNGYTMLGSTESQTGHSWYAGIQVPALVTEKGRIGVEWNKGSKYWRPVTYGEDTVIGSKLAARGTAWEVYYIQPLIGKDTLTMDLRFTQIKYDYTGSNAFFGYEGMPLSIDEAKAAYAAGMGSDVVEKASDIRVAFRYRY